MSRTWMLGAWLSCAVCQVGAPAQSTAFPLPIDLNVLFLGDHGHHAPFLRHRQLAPVLEKRGIRLEYTDRIESLAPRRLAAFDGLIVFANIDRLPAEQERALLDFVAAGKGFAPLHCASYCFHNSDAYVQLVGAQFKRHGTGVFRTELASIDHPILKQFSGFASWDETYVHHRHNEADRAVLEYRVADGQREPWTWTRLHGKGRVFYTAWGHDERTWSHPGFQNLVERGLRWACGKSLEGMPAYVDRPALTAKRTDVAPIETMPAKVPYYPAGKRWGVTSEPIPRMPKPLSVAESVKHFVVPVGFQVVPFVAEDKLGGKPLAMTWDERGRLFVALTRDYPNELQVPGQGRDRIVVCEDADGDGVCDRVALFADALSVPTSLLPIAGGIVVHQPRQTLFLKDTDGDGKADLRTTLLDGWGHDDTHAGPSNLRYGPDDWVYGMVGYAGFRGVVAGEAHDFRQGFYRFKLSRPANEPHRLVVDRLEFLRSTNNNSWGVGFSEEGLLFGSTANGCPSVFVPIPNRYYEKVRGLAPPPLESIALDNHIEPITDKVRQVDWHGGFTAGAGHALYTARVYPPEYWNRTAFICEPTGHLIATMVLQPAGSGFVARYGWNLVASDDEWSAPIAAEVGPDGNVWFIDWYNYIVQHNPTPAGFATGRGNAYETPLRDKTHGRIYRVVYAAGKADPPLDLSAATDAELVAALSHPNMTWRLHARRLLVERKSPLAPTPRAAAPANAKLLAADPQWRLQELLAAADAAEPSVERGRALADAWLQMRLSDDRHLQSAATIAAAQHPTGFLERVLEARDVHWRPEDVQTIRTTAGNWTARAQRGSLNRLLPKLASAAAPVQTAVLAGLAAHAGAPAAAEPLDASAEAAIVGLMETAPLDVRVQVVRLARRWGIKGLTAQLAKLSAQLLERVENTQAADAIRVDAVRQLAALQADEPILERVVAALEQKSNPDFVRAVFEALPANAATARLTNAVLAKLGDLPPIAQPAALRFALARTESAAAFLDGVEAGRVRFDALALDQRIALAAHPDKALAARARKLLAQGGGLPDPDRQKVIDSLASTAARPGNAGLGKALYSKHCAKCHRHGSEGTAIGPDLTGMAVHPKHELLIHLLDPSRSVEGNFRAQVAVLADGRIMTGLLGAETRTTVELIDSEGKRHSLQRSEVEALKATNKSLMPDGFEKQMTAAEIGNLLEFLVQKGRFVPIALDRFATVCSTRGMFHDESAELERLIFRDWSPKTVGDVPFLLVDPKGTTVKNAVMLRGQFGMIPPRMPNRVVLPCNTAAKAIHLLSGVGGWNYPATPKGAVSMVVALHYLDGAIEEHPLVNGIHFADYIRRVDVPGSRFAFRLRDQQIRMLSVRPNRQDVIAEIELRKGPDPTAPVVMAVTVERDF